MYATFVDLRKKSKEIINAMNRKEKVTLFCLRQYALSQFSFLLK